MVSVSVWLWYPLLLIWMGFNPWPCRGVEGRCVAGPTGATGATGSIGNLTFDLVPSADNTYNLGAPGFSWDTIYASNIYLGNTGATTAIMTVNGNLFSYSSATNYLTVNDGALITDLTATGTTTIDFLDLSGYVISNIVPNVNNQYSLGSFTNRFKNIYAYNVYANISVDTRNDMIVNATTTYLLFVTGPVLSAPHAACSCQSLTTGTLTMTGATLSAASAAATLSTLTLNGATFSATSAAGTLNSLTTNTITVNGATFSAASAAGTLSSLTANTITVNGATFSAASAAGTLSTLTLNGATFSAASAAGTLSSLTANTITVNGATFSAGNAAGSLSSLVVSHGLTMNNATTNLLFITGPTLSAPQAACSCKSLTTGTLTVTGATFSAGSAAGTLSTLTLNGATFSAGSAAGTLSSLTSGTITVTGATFSAGSAAGTLSSLTMTGASNQLIFQPGGSGNSFTINGSPNPGQATTLTIPDPGSSSSNFVLTSSTAGQTISGEITINNAGNSAINIGTGSYAGTTTIGNSLSTTVFGSSPSVPSLILGVSNPLTIQTAQVTISAAQIIAMTSTTTTWATLISPTSGKFAQIIKCSITGPSSAFTGGSTPVFSWYYWQGTDTTNAALSSSISTTVFTLTNIIEVPTIAITGTILTATGILHNSAFGIGLSSGTTYSGGGGTMTVTLLYYMSP